MKNDEMMEKKSAMPKKTQIGRKPNQNIILVKIVEKFTKNGIFRVYTTKKKNV